MSVVHDIRTTIDPTPFFAVLGITDLAAEKVRGARARAEAVRDDLVSDFDPATVQSRASEFAGRVQELPSRALSQGVAAGGRMAEGYADLATRGEGLVRRIRTQQATRDLVAQAEATLAQARGAVSTARKAVADVERSAKASITTGRREAAKVATTLADSVADEAQTARTEVAAAVKRTGSAAKRTRTTTTKAAKRTAGSTTAVRSSTRKTATTGGKAVRTAAAKVGD
jgi:heparin binding hemagglutinin HbhA